MHENFKLKKKIIYFSNQSSTIKYFLNIINLPYSYPNNYNSFK